MARSSSSNLTWTCIQPPPGGDVPRRGAHGVSRRPGECAGAGPGPRAVAADPALQQVEGAFGVPAEVRDDARALLAGEPAHREVPGESTDHRADLGRHEGRGHVVRIGLGLVGERGGEPLLAVPAHHLHPGLQCRALPDPLDEDLRALVDPIAPVARVQGREEVAPHRLDRRLAGPALADHARQHVHALLAAVEEQVLLRAEVVEHRVDGHVGRPRDLGHRDVVEPPHQEQPRRDVGDPLPGLPLLPLPQALFHVPILRAGTIFK